jgi:membrane-bound serine protease (ClpP class)
MLWRRYNLTLVKHRSSIVVIAAFIAAFLASSLATAQTESKTADVIDLSGVWDGRIIDFAIDSIEAAAASGSVEYVVLAIDSEGVVAGSEQLAELAELVADPPLPVVTWIGAAPARAYGGAAQVALAADVVLAAPGSEIGYLEPTIAGDEESAPVIDLAGLADLVDDAALVDDTGLFDEVGPESAAPRQVGQFLNGREVATSGGAVVLQTVREFEGGVTNLETVIREPDLVDQFFRLAASPEAAFFFLVAGLTVAAFEFYAIGPGIAAGTAAVSLVLAGYGLAVLPVRWWAVALASMSVLLMAWSYQRGGIFLFTTLGILGLAVAGLWFTDAAPQITPGIPGVLLTIGSAAFFFLLAMPTVARSRFSTQTIGREALVGRVGRAVTALTPDGEVDIDGAVWRATSHREAGISPGDPIEVIGVEGWYLEVDVPS